MAKYGTLFFDSGGELARLFFSYDMKKHAGDLNQIRQMQNYPGATERMNMFVRRCKDYRNRGIEIVFTAHEDIEKIYARGGAMAKKGESAPDPVAVKGWPDFPGKRAPDEFCRAADNVLHVRYVGGKPSWIARRESIGTGAEYWEVKDRFNGPAIQGGVLPADYNATKQLVLKTNPEWWQPPYIWVLYGPFGIGKTRSALTFPPPIKLFNLDHGEKSLTQKELETAQIELVNDINPEEGNDYERFLTLVEASV